MKFHTLKFVNDNKENLKIYCKNGGKYELKKILRNFLNFTSGES